MAAPVGTVCTFRPYRWAGRGEPPAVGDYLLSEGGAYYRVLSSEPLDGNPCELELRALKLGSQVDTGDTRVIRLTPPGRL